MHPWTRPVLVSPTHVGILLTPRAPSPPNASGFDCNSPSELLKTPSPYGDFFSPHSKST